MRALLSCVLIPVDRVAGPPPELLPLLKKIKRMMDTENLDIFGVFENQGGSKYGTMIKTRFISVLRDLLLKIHVFTEYEIHMVCKAYGTGADDTHCPGEKESMAWMDFCEDLVGTDGSFMPAEMAPSLGFEKKKKPMSAQAMLIDASDGVMDGAISDAMYEHHTVMEEDKRWA